MGASMEEIRAEVRATCTWGITIFSHYSVKLCFYHALLVPRLMDEKAYVTLKSDEQKSVNRVWKIISHKRDYKKLFVKITYLYYIFVFVNLLREQALI